MYTFRVCPWFNTETNESLYGIQARMGRGKWAHAIDGKEVVLFKDEEAAVAKMKAMLESAKLRGLA